MTAIDAGAGLTSTNPVRTSTGAPRSAAIDGLRAVAAFMVLVAHATRSAGLDDHTFIWRVQDRAGDLAIVTFFMLSGFFLYRPIAAAHLAGRRAPSARRFFRRRAVRVLPAYWAALSVALWVCHTNTPANGGETLLYYSLTQSYRRGYDLRGLFVAWTLVVEVAFYVTLPILAVVVSRATPRAWDRRARMRAQLGVLAAVYLASAAFRFHVLAVSSWKINWPPCFGDWFALGMLLAVGHAWVAGGGELPRFVRRLAQARWACWSVAGLLLVGLAELHLDLAPNRSTVMAAFALYGLAGIGLVLPFALAPTRASVVMRTLGSPLGEWLGLTAYGVYLWHGVLLPQIDESVYGHDFAPGFWPRFLVLSGCSLLLGAASWYLIEKPSMWALARWEQRTAKRPDAPPASRAVQAPY